MKQSELMSTVSILQDIYKDSLKYFGLLLNLMTNVCNRRATIFNPK